jgi:single-stranded DNA-binding protein
MNATFIFVFASLIRPGFDGHAYVEGKLKTWKWEDCKGDKRTTVELVASQMRILDSARKNANGATADASINEQPQGQANRGDVPFSLKLPREERGSGSPIYRRG